MALPGSSATTVNSDAKGNYLFPFILVTSLFFFWGFLHNLDPILIPHLRHSFSLTTLEASLVDSSVFIAYFVMAIPAGIIIKKYGYKTGVLVGLSFFSIGCFLFVPAANTMVYAFFLGALFVVACGLTILETAANPYATFLGAPETATQRLNFAQSFNGLAAFIAPWVGGHFIMNKEPLPAEQVAAMDEAARKAYFLSETATVKMPYIILGSVILLIAAVFYFTHLPDIREKDEVEKEGFLHAFKHKHLAWGVVAQFFYVGAQVCILSLLVLYATKAAGVKESDAKYFSSAAGMAFMIGRFAGTFFMQFLSPAKLLAIYAAINVALCAYVVSGSGMGTLYAQIGIAFFMSIMFPTIFALGIKDLGVDTKPGSSLIIMAIVGGAVFPPLLGFIADKTGNFQYGYIVPLVCFAVVAWFGISGHKVKSIEHLS